jgi:putative ABC transport system permease protein
VKATELRVVQDGTATVAARSNGVVATDDRAPDWSSVLGPLASQATGSMALDQSTGSALEALRANKLRAFLTMLGIIIGVGAVIVMVALGAGAKAAVQERLDRLGTNLLTIQPGSAAIGGVQVGTGSLASLNDLDVQAIQRQIPDIARLTPFLSMNGIQVVANNRNWNTTLQAAYPALFTLQDWQLDRGVAFSERDETSSALVCDVGATVAHNLFGNANPVGRQILVRNVPLTVKGVLAPKGSNGARDQDDVILMPYSTAQIRLFQRTSVNGIAVQVDDTKNIDKVMRQITSLLRLRHHLRANQPDDFRIQNNNQIIQAVQETSNTLTLLIAGVAAVSLIVGGIGIMNIMFVSVSERTREIGIRMAVGARARNILSQFLIEALLLSLIGGIIGVLVGVGTSVGLSQLAGWNTLVTPSAILISFGFAALVGIFFGFYPARKASQLDPIDALRYE